VSVALAAIGVVLIAASIAFGIRVAAHPPEAFDRLALGARGRWLGVATVFTRLGRWYGVIGIIYAAFIVAVNARISVLPVLVVAFAQIVSQAMSALMKRLFGRVRPVSITAHEPDFSYPSGHSVTAVTLYGGFALLALHAPLPQPVTILMSLALAVCVIGIPWSRLALGAHYASDVAGGLMLGAGWLGVTFGALEHFGYTFAALAAR
jgi:undecaprenyl-diphosphatase